MSKTSTLLSELTPGCVVWTEVNVEHANKQPVYGTALSRQWAAQHAPFTMERVGEDCSEHPRHRDRYRILNRNGEHYFVWGHDGCWCREQAELIVERSNTAAALHLMAQP